MPETKGNTFLIFKMDTVTLIYEINLDSNYAQLQHVNTHNL